MGLWQMRGGGGGGEEGQEAGADTAISMISAELGSLA